MVKIETRELNEIVDSEFKDKVLREISGKEVLIVPEKLKTGKVVIPIESVILLKQIKKEIPKSSILDKEKTELMDLRSVDFELPLFLIENPWAIGILSGLISGALLKLADAILARKKKEPNNPLISEPTVKVKVYETKTKRYFEFEGPASNVGKEIIESLK